MNRQKNLKWRFKLTPVYIRIIKKIAFPKVASKYKGINTPNSG